MPAGRHQVQYDLWDKFFRDKNGNYAVWQWPNPWLIGWAVSTLVSLVTLGKVSDVFSLIGTGLLIIWCLLEIFLGDSYFRRTLGLVVLAFSVTMIIKTL
jgi:hypothetical protein